MADHTFVIFSRVKELSCRVDTHVAPVTLGEPLGFAGRHVLEFVQTTGAKLGEGVGGGEIGGEGVVQGALDGVGRGEEGGGDGGGGGGGWRGHGREGEGGCKGE